MNLPLLTPIDPRPINPRFGVAHFPRKRGKKEPASMLLTSLTTSPTFSSPVHGGGVCVADGGGLSIYSNLLSRRIFSMLSEILRASPVNFGNLLTAKSRTASA